MKKILFTVIIIAGAFQLKAQQKFGTIDSMLLKAPKNLDQFKLSDSSLFRNFNLPKQNQLALLNNLRDDKNAEIFYSMMPVLKIGGRNDKMAIIKPQSNEHYTMLIKRIKVVDPFATVKPDNQ
ncbi:MAG TPA: hypothetical protein VFE54_11395 [Mucilaginibacter sp.]|jgi:hypothetical protein|nr:hypothetical protein [Mucilaginibacter sp.]